MTTETDSADRARISALTRIDRAERGVKIWLALAGLCEGSLLVAYVCLANFGDRVHVLILIGACLVYTTLAFGLLALGSYVRQNTLRVLRAIESLPEQT